MIKWILLFLFIPSLAWGAWDINPTSNPRIAYDNPGYGGTAQPFSIGAWFYIDSVPGTNNIIMLNDASANVGAILRHKSTGVMEGRVDYSVTNSNIDGTTTIPTGQWVHLLWTWDGNPIMNTHFKMYINGTEETYNSITDGSGTEEGTDGEVILSNVSTNDDYKIAYIGYWGKVLDQNEIDLLASGYAPECLLDELYLAPDLSREEIDPISGGTGTVTGSAVIIDNPPVIRCK